MLPAGAGPGSRETHRAVAVEHLRVRRGGREILHDLTFSISPGSITGVLGPSGCGKSTVLRSIVGVQVVQAGRITVLGLPAGSPALRRRVGYATQTPSVYPDLSIFENLRYFATVLGAPSGDPDRVLAEVGLDAQRTQQVARLSGGQFSRVNLAVALLGRPELLILDEPTVGLDPVLREELWDLFNGLSRTRGLTLLISSHVMDEAERCQSLLLMRDGSILAHDTPAALLARTGANDLEGAFLSLVKGLPPEGRKV